MEKITRRAALAVIPSAVALPALSASSVTEKYGPHDPNHPWNRVRRHAGDLATALDEAGADQYAIVYPRTKADWPILYGDIESLLRVERRDEETPVSREYRRYIKARDAFDAQARLVTTVEDEDVVLADQKREYLAAVAAVSVAMPASAKDFAMQLLVNTDHGQAPVSDDFIDAARRLADT